MLLGTLSASSLGNILTGKEGIAKRQGRRINRTGEGTVRAGYGNKKGQKKKKMKKDKIIKKLIFNAASSFN